MRSEDTSSRDNVLALLEGRRYARIPCFSGLISATVSGLDELNLQLSEVHRDASKMAAAAAASYQLFGLESVSVPLDMCVEAEALGAEVDFRVDAPHPELPRIVAPLADSTADFDVDLPDAVAATGRVPIVREAIRLLKQNVGNTVAVGAWVPGPVTLAMQIVNVQKLMRDIALQEQVLNPVLDQLTDLLIGVANAYRSSGADFITVHEMGGSPGFVGPPTFEKLVLPRLKRLLDSIPAPRVLSVCGDTNRAMPLLAAAGANALSVDQTNDLARSREVLGPEVVLLGNIDPIGALAHGTGAAVRSAVEQAISAGVDAVWPACDLWPLVPAENMIAMIDEAGKHRRTAV
ncbi:MAG: uroporphyrinogen decarboxylase family protein [Anaerolineales bacterium]